MDDETNNLLRAILALLIENRAEEAKRAKKDEVILADNGLRVSDIAKLTGKSEAAVSKTIQRARK